MYVCAIYIVQKHILVYNGRHMKKNGKIIKCKTCGKSLYISASRFSFKKYCSNDCARADNYGFKPKKRKCVICGNDFTILSQLKMQKKTCSDECHRKLCIQISRKNAERKRNTERN